MGEQGFQKGRLRREGEKDQERIRVGLGKGGGGNGGLRDTSLGEGGSEATDWGWIGD